MWCFATIALRPKFKFEWNINLWHLFYDEFEFKDVEANIAWFHRLIEEIKNTPSIADLQRLRPQIEKYEKKHESLAKLGKVLQTCPGSTIIERWRWQTHRVNVNCVNHNQPIIMINDNQRIKQKQFPFLLSSLRECGHKNGIGKHVTFRSKFKLNNNKPLMNSNAQQNSWMLLRFPLTFSSFAVPAASSYYDSGNE